MSKDSFLWEGHDRYVTRLKDLSAGSSTVLFYRERKSHQGSVWALGWSIKRFSTSYLNWKVWQS